MRLRSISLASLLVAASLAGVAAAKTYDFSFSGTEAGGVATISASGVLTVSNILNSFGGYSVLGITGTISGDTLTGLDADTPSTTDVPYYQDTAFLYDNTVFNNPGAQLDDAGIGVHSATADYNLGEEYIGDGIDLAFIFTAVGSTFGTEYDGTYTFTAVSGAPEPKTWTLMLAGVVGAGLTLRRARRSKQDLIAATCQAL